MPNFRATQCWDVSLKSTNGVTRGKFKGPPKSVGFILWEPWMSVHFTAIHLIVVEILCLDQSGGPTLNNYIHCTMSVSINKSNWEISKHTAVCLRSCWWAGGSMHDIMQRQNELRNTFFEQCSHTFHHQNFLFLILWFCTIQGFHMSIWA